VYEAIHECSLRNIEEKARAGHRTLGASHRLGMMERTPYTELRMPTGALKLVG